ncbi:C4-dicarboxylate transport protein [compost metagenome]
MIHDIPLAGLALLIGIDRFMSEARALTSLASNAVATVVISISENACNRETLIQTLDGKPVPAEALAKKESWEDLEVARNAKIG